MSDPRYTDPRLSDPVLRRDEAVNGKWGWIAGIAVRGADRVSGDRGREQPQQHREQWSAACHHRQHVAAAELAGHHRLGHHVAEADDAGGTGNAGAEQERHAITLNAAALLWCASRRAGAARSFHGVM